MPLRRKVVLSANANQDLKEILAFTERVWGKDQRSRYRQMIRKHLRQLGDLAEIGQISEVSEHDYRQLVAGSHIVFYYFDDSTVYVDRIPHAHRDALPILD